MQERLPCTHAVSAGHASFAGTAIRGNMRPYIPSAAIASDYEAGVILRDTVAVL